MDTMQAIQDYEESRNQNHKAQILQALLDDDAKLVKSLGWPYVDDARKLSEQGVIKLPKGF